MSTIENNYNSDYSLESEHQSDIPRRLYDLTVNSDETWACAKILGIPKHRFVEQWTQKIDFEPRMKFQKCAEILDVSQKTIERYVADGTLIAVGTGKNKRILQSSFKLFHDTQMELATQHSNDALYLSIAKKRGLVSVESPALPANKAEAVA